MNLSIKYPTIAVFLLLCLLILSTTKSYSQKWEKSINKMDALYKVGDYEKAAKLNSKFKKKTDKKLGKANEYTILYYLMAARNNLADGKLDHFYGHLGNALETSKKVNRNSPEKHVSVLIKTSQLYIRYGDYAEAMKFAKEASSMSTNLKENKELNASIDLNFAELFSGMGYYKKASEIILNNENFYKYRAVRKQTFIDPKSGKLKTSRLPEDLVLKRMDDFAHLLNLKSNNYRMMGNFQSSDSAFMQTSEWIGKNLGKTNIRYVENLLRHGQLLDENGLDPKITRKSYENALSQLKKEHNESHYLALEIYESLMKSYMVNNETGRFKNIKSDYERVIRKYFERASIHFTKRDIVDFYKEIEKENTKKTEKKVLTLLSTSKAIPEFHHERIKLYEILYQIALVDKSYINAETYLQEILKNKEALFGKESPTYHLTFTEVANFYVDFTNKIHEAGKIYEESFVKIVKPEISEKHVSYVHTLNHQAKYFEGTDDYESAALALKDALLATRSKYDNEDRTYGLELEKIASLQLKIGAYDEATENMDLALEILDKEQRNPLNVVYFIKALETSAKLKSLKGEFDSAEDDLRKSFKLLKRAEDLTNYDETASTVDLADVYVKFGQISKTEELLNRAIIEYENIYGLNSHNLITPLLSYGNLKLFVGDYTEAEKITRRALNIALEDFGDNSTKTAFCKKLLAQIYTSIGDYDKAELNITEALAVQEKKYGREHIEVAKSLSQLGLIKYYKLDDPQSIEPTFDEAKQIINIKLGNRSPLYADVLKDLSVLYIQQHRYDDAFNALSLAEAIWEFRLNTSKNINAAAIYMLTGDVYYQQKDYANAELKYEKAKKLFESFFSDEHPEYVKVLSKLSKVYYMQGDTRKAKKTIQDVINNYDNFIKSYFPALSEREKAKFWNTIKGDYEFYNTIALEFKDEDPKLIEQIYNNALLTKAILLSSSIKIRQKILNGDDDELKALYNEWLSKKEFLTSVLSMRTDQLEENAIVPSLLINEVEQLEKQLSEKSDVFDQSAGQSKIEWQNVQEALKENEVAIEMVRFRYFNHIFTDSVIYAGLYVKNAKVAKKPGLFTIHNGEELESRYFKVYRNSIIYKIKDHYSYKQYWEPIIKAIGPTNTIYLSADGVYNQINLEAIPLDDQKYVIDNSNIILVSNTKDIYFDFLKQKSSTNNNATIFGNPLFYVEASAKKTSKIDQLPGTEKEIDAINDLLKTSGWVTSAKTEQKATEAEIKSVDNPRVFHVATHGFFTPAVKTEQNTALEGQNEAKISQNPLLRTGLLMTGAGDLLDKTSVNYNMDDGILTAYEAMSMNLDKTDLVVLSACETGLGDLTVGEGVYGLQRAFMVAGAQTLIMSMFKVNDEATQKLMINFYTKWLATGLKRQSFVDAKKELRNEYKDPIYWGAFIMIGLE